MDQCEVAVDPADLRRISGSDAGEGLVAGHVEDDVGGRVEEVDEPFDRGVMDHGPAPAGGGVGPRHTV